MFDSIGNLPLHPLVLHAVVIGIPLSLLLALLFALPRTRRWARWPLGVTVLGSLAATFVAKQSGEALERALGINNASGPVGTLITRHAQLANQLLLIMFGFAVVTVAAVLLVRIPAAGPRAAAVQHRALDLVLVLLVLVAALVAAYWVYRVGDIGSRAVWNPAGTQSY